MNSFPQIYADENWPQRGTQGAKRGAEFIPLRRVLAGRRSAPKSAPWGVLVSIEPVWGKSAMLQLAGTSPDKCQHARW